eukprot:m51a1_g4877 hypothetical protein (859) ;mRNA; f:390173-393196
MHSFAFVSFAEVGVPEEAALQTTSGSAGASAASDAAGSSQAPDKVASCIPARLVIAALTACIVVIASGGAVLVVAYWGCSSNSGRESTRKGPVSLREVRVDTASVSDTLSTSSHSVHTNGGGIPHTLACPALIRANVPGVPPNADSFPDTCSETASIYDAKVDLAMSHDSHTISKSILSTSTAKGTPDTHHVIAGIHASAKAASATPIIARGTHDTRAFSTSIRAAHTSVHDVHTIAKSIADVHVDNTGTLTKSVTHWTNHRAVIADTPEILIKCMPDVITIDASSFRAYCATAEFPGISHDTTAWPTSSSGTGTEFSIVRSEALDLMSFENESDDDAIAQSPQRHMAKERAYHVARVKRLCDKSRRSQGSVDPADIVIDSSLDVTPAKNDCTATATRYKSSNIIGSIDPSDIVIDSSLDVTPMKKNQDTLAIGSSADPADIVIDSSLGVASSEDKDARGDSGAILDTAFDSGDCDFTGSINPADVVIDSSFDTSPVKMNEDTLVIGCSIAPSDIVIEGSDDVLCAEDEDATGGTGPILDTAFDTGDFDYVGSIDPADIVIESSIEVPCAEDTDARGDAGAILDTEFDSGDVDFSGSVDPAEVVIDSSLDASPTSKGKGPAIASSSSTTVAGTFTVSSVDPADIVIDSSFNASSVDVSVAKDEDLAIRCSGKSVRRQQIVSEDVQGMAVHSSTKALVSEDADDEPAQETRCAAAFERLAGPHVLRAPEKQSDSDDVHCDSECYSGDDEFNSEGECCAETDDEEFEPECCAETDDEEPETSDSEDEYELVCHTQTSNDSCAWVTKPQDCGRPRLMAHGALGPHGSPVVATRSWCSAMGVVRIAFSDLSDDEISDAGLVL